MLGKDDSRCSNSNFKTEQIQSHRRSHVKMGLKRPQKPSTPEASRSWKSGWMQQIGGWVSGWMSWGMDDWWVDGWMGRCVDE